MNVILLEKIGKLGEIGDTANVKSGYARNFLFPKGKFQSALATRATRVVSAKDQRDNLCVWA